jgi:Ferritin-like domain
VTTYSSIIDKEAFFKRLASDDQGYLVAARQEEMSHYNLEKAVTSKESPFTMFYYPMGMYDNAQVTLNTLVTLEDAFIAAYLIGVRRFSNSNLRVTSARIMGIESDHRTLGLTDISQAVNALLPFVDPAKAQAAGFDTSRTFKFQPFMPTLPSPLREFIAF